LKCFYYLQVLVEHGERRKVISIEKDENLDQAKNKVKKNFEIRGAIVLQEYDWEAWLDVEDTRSRWHQQKLKCVTTVDKEDSLLITEIEKVIFFIHILNLGIFSHMQYVFDILNFYHEHN
jgi:hypothetical protein